MNKKLIIFINIFLLSIFLISAQELYIDYLDGVLEVKNNDYWEILDIGDLLSYSKIFKLSNNGYVELLSGDSKIVLDKDGIYEAEFILDNISVANKWGIKGSAFTKLFNYDKNDIEQAAAMGVRGDALVNEQLLWIDEDEEFLEEGLILYKSGKYSEALNIFDEGAQWFGSNYEEILFYKARSEYETGRYREMRDSLLTMNPDSEASYFSDYILFKGNVLIESQNYREAEELFDNYIFNSVNRERDQMILFLSAYCSIWQEDKERAKRKLSRSFNLNPLSDTGKKAYRVLNNLE